MKPVADQIQTKRVCQQTKQAFFTQQALVFQIHGMGGHGGRQCCQIQKEIK